MNYSNYHFRIKTLRMNQGYTWLFLPGGPGLGSAYLESLCLSLDLPGTTLLIDFPKDGTNTEGLLNFSYWKKGLIDLLGNYDQPILVTHSFSGMFALDTPELEPLLKVI
jgi:pimeloyl-ACP methyl ester carboxylesterase